MESSLGLDYIGVDVFVFYFVYDGKPLEYFANFLIFVYPNSVTS